MARVSQYKALGTKLGGYKSTLSKIQSKEYGKKHADWKAQEEISLYNQIGGTVANVIGIAQESRLAREQADTYAREFGIDPGGKFAKRVTKEGKEQNPWLKLSEEAQDEAFWADENMSDKVVGVDWSEADKYKSDKVVGVAGNPYAQQGLVGGIADTETAYQESLKRFSPSPSKSAHQLESEALKRGTTEGTADDKVFNAMADPSRAGDIEKIRGGFGEELEFGHAAQKEVKPEVYPSSSYTKAEQYSTSATAGKKGVEPEYAGMIETERDEETSMGHVVRKRQKEIFSTLLKPERPKVSTVDEQPSPITNDMAFDAIAEPSLGDFKLPSRKENVIKQARSVAGDRGDELEMVFGMESSFGQDPNAKGNILQIKNASLRAEAKAAKIDFSNPAQVSKFYMKKTDEFTKGFDEVYTDRSGTKVEVYKDLSQFGIDKGGANYLTWQQGRFGVLDMTTALKTGRLGDETRKNMLNNVSEKQRKQLLNEKDTKQFIRAYLNIQSSKMKGYK